MKNLYALTLIVLVSLCATAQISTYPYTESFDASSQCTGWTVTTGTWYHNTSTGTIEVDNHNQTNVHAYLFSPWLNTNSLAHPVLQFDLRINADNPSACVPQLDLGYTDSSGSGAVNVIQFNIASNNQCVGTASSYYGILNNQWTTLTFPLVWYNHIQLEFNSVFPGTGTLEIRNAYIGERQGATGIEEELDKAFTVFPIPASNQLYLPKDFPAASNIQMVDMLGRVVYCSSENKGVIDVSTIPEGTYILHIHTQTSYYTKRIAITHE
ncbi:MAG: T9SS type A sorting domain-containing protein [Bacteroidetes bacterium]|nr:T9SS type A sorting domain-containing protein [Bacteroidota bacterium]